MIDAAANPERSRRRDGRTSSRQSVEHNLLGTLERPRICEALPGRVHLTEFQPCVFDSAFGLASRATVGGAYRVDATQDCPPASLRDGVTENFSTEAPVSLYGGTKLASECLALEYGAAFGCRCG